MNIHVLPQSLSGSGREAVNCIWSPLSQLMERPCCLICVFLCEGFYESKPGALDAQYSTGSRDPSQGPSSSSPSRSTLPHSAPLTVAHRANAAPLQPQTFTRVTQDPFCTPDFDLQYQVPIVTVTELMTNLSLALLISKLTISPIRSVWESSANVTAE